MKRNFQPQGLYHPDLEHDACGIGLYAHLKGKASHDVVEKGLYMLCQMEHRGGQGSDAKTGDGAGIMLQIPHAYLQAVCDMAIPEQGRYGVGMIFFPQEQKARVDYQKKIEDIIKAEGQILLGWRDVPVNPDTIGEGAKASQPYIQQLIVGASDDMEDTIAFERKLYIIRKKMEKLEQGEENGLYVASFSSRTIVYKGLLTPDQIRAFYLDLQDERFASAFALVHSRFSTNTFPSWERAHPNRYLVHNGEINTLRGNINWMRAREKQFVSDAFGEELEKVLPVIDMNGSDSSILDNSFEFFVLAGRTPAQVAMMMIPEPWVHEDEMDKEKKAFYEYHSSLMEPWDGPTAISFTDGKQIGAILDRNGLRPIRYYVTKDDYIILSSEVGVVDVKPEEVAYKDRLSPGKMLLVDIEEGRIVSDEEIKQKMAKEQPYRQWVEEQMISVDELPAVEGNEASIEDVLAQQIAFGYTYEDVTKNIVPTVEEGKDPIISMGTDTPLAVLSDRPQLLFNYFKQSFAQVTNPPIDAIREHDVTSTVTFLGAEGNLLHPDAQAARRIRLETPILFKENFWKINNNPYLEFQAATLSLLFKSNLKSALDELFRAADQAVESGARLLILSDRGVNKTFAAIPTLLAVSGLHHHLVEKGTRTKVSILLETGEAREVHHFAMLIGYGADAIYPYLVFETLKQLIQDGSLSMDEQQAEKNFIAAATDGVVKVMSKMGISTVQSYRGAQIFEALGIGSSVIENYFKGTPSKINGIGLDVIEQEVLLRHEKAFAETIYEDKTLETGSDFQWRKHGEHHAFNPGTIHTLQQACRAGDYELFKKYSKQANKEQLAFLRNLFTFKDGQQSIPLEEVESVDSIVRRFKTGAMSFGALSQEAHEALAIAMNRLGARSNSGEGGEDPKRNIPDANGDLRRSAIKQVASGRFGVTSQYLVNADEIQIKMAQGAKPGEGGQLPGKKVYPWVAEVRGATPGVGLISPPPHHDIYSIEDLAQLIHDVKNSNPSARISVKLVSKAGVGTIAAGVAKAVADVIVISGYDGGTGASPRTSVKHAGMPWELGLAEAHQTLLINQLRDRVVLETDGKLMTGHDVIMAALLGAEEFGFSTAPLVVLGCVMMRVCHKDTCPVGVATQNPELRKKFMGSPDDIVNFMLFVAQEVREIMAQLGFRTIEEMVGRTDMLAASERAASHWKAKHLDLSAILYQPEVAEGTARTFKRPQQHKLEQSLDIREILPQCETAIREKKPVELSLPIRNTNRVVGTILGSEVTKQHGEAGLPEDTIQLNFNGSAGQSFGAFVPKGITLQLEGDANDFVGKGLSGGKIIVRPSSETSFSPEENVIIGNVAFYGGTSGEAYIYGQAGERFAVRNSGVHTVVEGVGDHGCEYMTGGRVVILGDVGKNFAAGMSGGIAYVLVEDKEAFAAKCNLEMVLLETLEDEKEIEEVVHLISNHFHYTGSLRAANILANWDEYAPYFVKVIPSDYKQVAETIEGLKETGMSEEEAVRAAFEAHTGQTKVSIIKTDEKTVVV
ncbi:glutamate synthase large subunit [Ectobacillus panaciterrae]|uniref:glutamate synthase large subunit n=1 Tax=Ectobacillus panaciterrae TaxID=363872 RepID=UPI00040097EA|nr:glutamate synthase large subunit [Ectobacillus panaciterrae]